MGNPIEDEVAHDLRRARVKVRMLLGGVMVKLDKSTKILITREKNREHE